VAFFTLSDRALAWLAGAIVFMSLCFRLGHLPLLAPDEGRNAEVGREIKESGYWLVPTYNGMDYLDKPVFYFKAVALSLALVGDNETGARLPSAVFGVALVIVAFAFCRKVYGTRCGLLAAIVIATTPLFATNARTVIFDIALAFFTCSAIFCGFLAETFEGKAQRNWYLLGAASAGLGTLVKGPVGFLVPMLVLLVFNRVERRKGAWKRLLAWPNVVIFLAVTLPWFIGLCVAHRDFLHYGLVEESFHRFTSAKTFHRSQPFYFYLIVVAAAFFPWSLLLPEAALAAWKERWATQSADRLCLVWALVVVLFFSLSQSKLPGYILSVTVASGILIARLIEAALRTPASRAVRLMGRATAVFAVICLLSAIVVIAGAPHSRLLAKPIGIPAADAESLGNACLPLAGLAMAFGVFAAVARWRRRALLCFFCLALFPPIFPVVGLRAFDLIFEAKSGRRMASQLSTLPKDTELACLECFPNGLPFYLGRTATLISKDGGELTSNYIIYSLKKAALSPPQVVPLTNFERWLASRKTPVFLIARQSNCEKLQTIAAARSGRIEQLPSPYLGVQLPPPSGL